MICVDNIQTIQPKGKLAARFGNQWCHMFSDNGNIEELHEMALKIGLKRSYFDSHKFLPHYDLIPSKRELALKCGAIERDSAPIVREAFKKAKSQLHQHPQQ
jgi:hypothetical protein